MTLRFRNSKKLLLVRILHTLIWMFFVSMIGVVLWSGINGKVSVYSWLAAIAVFLEGIVLLLFRGSCPLTGVARKYSSSPKANFDIYLPEWLARYNKQVFTTLYLFGLLLMVVKACK